MAHSRFSAVCVGVLTLALLGSMLLPQASALHDASAQTKMYGENGVEAREGKDQGALLEVGVRSLAGRRLLVREGAGGGQDLVLKRATLGARGSESVRSAAGVGGTELRHYLVRVAHPVRPGLAQELQVLAVGRVHYLPYDTFLVVLDSLEILLLVTEVAGVTEVWEYPSSLKIDGTLLPSSSDFRVPKQDGKDPGSSGEKDTASSEERRLGSNREQGAGKVVKNLGLVIVLVAAQDLGAIAAVATAWVARILDEVGVEVRVDIPSRRVVYVDVGSAEQGVVAAWLARQGLVRWVEPEAEVELCNAWASKGMQSADALSTPIFAKGINGTGEIVGVADTGVDFDSCYFRDDTRSLKWCVGKGVVPDCVDLSQRKIVSYRALDSGFNPLAPDGVAGSLFGHGANPPGHQGSRAFDFVMGTPLRFVFEEWEYSYRLSVPTGSTSH